MAEAHARMTGQIGVALVTAGAGLCNAVAPLFTAAQSQTPVLLLSGDSEAELDGRGSFQEMDQVQITTALTKFSQRIKETKNLIPIAFKAINLAKMVFQVPYILRIAADILAGDLDNGISDLKQVHKVLKISYKTIGKTLKINWISRKAINHSWSFFWMPCHTDKLKN